MKFRGLEILNEIISRARDLNTEKSIFFSNFRYFSCIFRLNFLLFRFPGMGQINTIKIPKINIFQIFDIFRVCFKHYVRGQTNTIKIPKNQFFFNFSCMFRLNFLLFRFPGMDHWVKTIGSPLKHYFTSIYHEFYVGYRSNPVLPKGYRSDPVTHVEYNHKRQTRPHFSISTEIKRHNSRHSEDESTSVTMSFYE